METEVNIDELAEKALPLDHFENFLNVFLEYSSSEISGKKLVFPKVGLYHLKTFSFLQNKNVYISKFLRKNGLV